MAGLSPRLVLLGMAAVAGAVAWSTAAPPASPPRADESVATLEPAPPAPVAPANLVLTAPIARAVGGLAPTVTVTPVPTRAPTAVPSRLAPNPIVLDGIRADLGARWMKNHRETTLRAGPSETAAAFNVLPQWSELRVLEGRGAWTYVQYQGDGATRAAGPGWTLTDDLGPVATPPVWLAATRSAPLWSDATPSARRLVDVGGLARLEVLGASPIIGTRIQVRVPGDGRTTPPGQGWVDAADVVRAPPPTAREIPWSYPAVLNADLRLAVPYRTQLDGSDYAQANCGPTTLGMALEAFGIKVDLSRLREQVLEAQDLRGDDAGTFIWALARVAERNGVRVGGLFDGSRETRYRRWNLDDIRAELRQNRPVVLQVYYRGLPRREESEYYGDHYIVVTGLLGDGFLYNDSIGGTSDREGPGWDRVMSGAQLLRAMDASDRPFAYTGFSVRRA